MRGMKAERKSSKAVTLLNILAVLMAFVMLISLGRMVSELRRVFDRDPYSGIEYALQEGDYAGMIRDYYYRGYDVAPFASVHEEEYRVAQYADAALYLGSRRIIRDIAVPVERTDYADKDLEKLLRALSAGALEKKTEFNKLFGRSAERVYTVNKLLLVAVGNPINRFVYKVESVLFKKRLCVGHSFK